MPEIKPFNALFYNQEKIEDLSKVVCPPYDVISPEQQEGFHNASPYNFTRIYLAKDNPEDDSRHNKYTRAKTIFEDWQKNGILVQDPQPCIYYYRQEYKVLGEKYTRLGFISLMKIENNGKKKTIYPHENTHAAAKEDRLKLWRGLSANLSSIFVCYSDAGKKVEKIFVKNVAPTKPFVDITDDDGVRHIVWRLDNPKLIREITDSLSEQQLFIADGHHRYEVAKELQKLRAQKFDKTTGKEPFNYVMTYFTDMDSRDLRIFPIHRIVKRLAKNDAFLEEFFRIDKIKSREELAILLAKAGQNEHAFGLYMREGIQLLRLKNRLLIDKHITEGSPAYRQLDATILQNFVFNRLGIRSEDIVYTNDINVAANAVDEARADASFILNPVRIQQLKEIALNGEKMPPKTTYFYPKVLSGLTVYKMEQ